MASEQSKDHSVLIIKAKTVVKIKDKDKSYCTQHSVSNFRWIKTALLPVCERLLYLFTSTATSTTPSDVMYDYYDYFRFRVRVGRFRRNSNGR